MSLWASLKNLPAKQLWNLALLAFGHPLAVWPTLSTTRNCLRICDQRYGRAHYGNGPANAFRHALWNVMLAKACYPKQLQKGLAWAKTVTDWHEAAFRNEPLERQMDLHNNAVGRALLQQLGQQPLDRLVETLAQMTENSQKLEHVAQQLDKNQLVHL